MQQTFPTKKVLIGVLVLLVLLGIFFMRGKMGMSEHAVVSPTGAKEDSDPHSLKALLAYTAPTKCTIASDADGQSMTGMVYVAGGKMRGDFTTTMKTTDLAGKSIAGHMIVDSDTSYMWSDSEMKMGIKMSRQEMLAKQTGAGNSPSAQAAADMERPSDIHCESWTTDEALFTPPTTITFQDIAAMMNGMMIRTSTTSATTNTKAAIPTGAMIPSGMTEDQLKQLCGSCDQAGDSRLQCRQALGCK